MPRIFILSLSTEDRNRLHLLIARGESWRERERAQTLLYLEDLIGNLPQQGCEHPTS